MCTRVFKKPERALRTLERLMPIGTIVEKHDWRSTHKAPSIMQSACRKGELKKVVQRGSKGAKLKLVGGGLFFPK